MKYKKLLFIIILVLAAFLRLYQLGDVPPGINRDEASIGYTAYSLLMTGKDEYGRFLPLSFQSFGDWKLPLYIHTSVPFVALLGLSDLAVRLPSALLGIVSVGLTYLLAKKLFDKEVLSILTMLLLALSPWHVHFSRVASEANMAVFLTILAVFFFLKGVREKTVFLVPTGICAALTYFTYAGSYIFTTLLLIGTVIFYRSEIPKTKYTIISVIFFILLSAIAFSQNLIGPNTTKLSGISIFGDLSVVHAQIEIPRNEHDDSGSLLARFTHNRVTFALERFGQNYLNSFSPNFLFIQGGTNKAHNIEDFGNMYLVEAPFLLLGIAFLLSAKKSKEKYFVLWWFFIAPVAASITKDAPHSARMLSILPILPLVTATGIYTVYAQMAGKKTLRTVAFFIVAFFFVANFGLYLDRYYVHFPREEGTFWGIGYKRLATTFSEETYKSKEVIMTNPQYSPYIFLLFYQKYNPMLYQKSALRYPPTEDKFIHVKSFDRFQFRDIDWDRDIKVPNRILIDDPSHIPDDLKYGPYNVRQVQLLNGESMFLMVETK